MFISPVSRQSSLQAFKTYICIYKDQKEHPTEDNQQRVSSFFKKQTCLKILKFAVLLTKEKTNTAMNEWENDKSAILRALYSVYKVN